MRRSAIRIAGVLLAVGILVGVAMSYGAHANGVVAPESAQMVINEVDADTVGTDGLEFVELYDGGVGNTSLDGLVLVFYNGSSDTSYEAFDLDGHATDANGYFLLGNEAVLPMPSIIFGGNTLQNGADAVALYSGNASDFPYGTPVTTEYLIDAIVYDTDDADDSGLLILLNPGEAQVNEDGANEKDSHSNQRCPNGVGGARNTGAYVQSLPTPGGANCTGSLIPPVPEMATVAMMLLGLVAIGVVCLGRRQTAR